MFNLGPLELIVVFIVALIVIGPKKMPELARALGRAIGEFKKATRELQSTLDVDLNHRDDVFASKARPEPPIHQPNYQHKEDGKQLFIKPEDLAQETKPEDQDPETTRTEQKNLHDR